MPSMYQIGHGACDLTSTEKLTWDDGLLKLINVAREPLGIPALTKLDNARVRIIFATHSHDLNQVIFLLTNSVYFENNNWK